MNKNELSADSLKTLGSLTGVRGALCPLLNPRSTVAFLIAVMRLLIAVGKLHHGIIERVRQKFTRFFFIKVMRVASFKGPLGIAVNMAVSDPSIS